LVWWLCLGLLHAFMCFMGLLATLPCLPCETP
jgi:hypothetical protein